LRPTLSRPPSFSLFPYTTLFRSLGASVSLGTVTIPLGDVWAIVAHRITPESWWTGSWEPWWSGARDAIVVESRLPRALTAACVRSEEHTSELQSRFDLVCRLLLE